MIGGMPLSPYLIRVRVEVRRGPGLGVTVRMCIGLG